MSLRSIRKSVRKKLNPAFRLYRVLTRAKGAYQYEKSTSFDRYPGIFSTAREYADRHWDGDIRVLSYGCSTGEECFSLRKLYFPRAEIIGADIDRRNIRKAEMGNTDARIRFIHSTEDELRKHGPYHMIFAMSVLCRWPQTEKIDDCSRVFPFEMFETAVRNLDGLLHPGGLLILYNANFRFRDAPLSSGYTVLNDSRIPESGYVHKFDVRNRKLENQDDAEVIFIKREVSS